MKAMKSSQPTTLPNRRRKHPASPFHGFAATLLTAMLAATAAQAADYNYGSATNNFTLNASDAARDVSGDGSFDNNTGDMGIYWRGSSSDITYMHFDLSLLQGMTLNGNVSLNYTINANWGGNVTGSQINTANGPWTGTPGSSAPGCSAIGDAINATGNFSSGQTATWAVPGATFLGFVGSPSYFGLALSGASGTTAHLTGTATLTGNATGPEIRVLEATDWSLATYDSGTKTLSLTNATISEGPLGGTGSIKGPVLVQTGAMLAPGTSIGTLASATP